MGKGQDRAGTIAGDHNNYYQTLIKSLILLLIQTIAKAMTGRVASAYPPPFMGMGPVWVM